MSGNRRHAGGVASAMANLAKLTGRNASVSVPDPTIIYTVEEVTEAKKALWRSHLTDRVIDQMINVLRDAIPKSPAQEKDHE